VAPEGHGDGEDPDDAPVDDGCFEPRPHETMVPVRDTTGNRAQREVPAGLLARADSPIMARRVKAPHDDGLPVPSPAERRARWPLGMLVAGGVALLALFFVCGFLYVNVPSGWSPRLGPERDVTGLFPRLWSWKAFALPSDATAPLVFGGRVRLLMCGLWLTYGLTVAVVFQLPRTDWRRALRVVAGASLLCHVVLVLMPPVVTGDLFHYALFGRMVSHYGLNPYITPANRLRADPLWPYASWNFLTTHYGPSFTYLSALVTWLSRGAVLGTAIGFKALAALMNLASCWLIRDISARWEQDDGLRAFTLYALNPVILFETAGMGHNEAIVVAFALTGIALAVRGHPWAALVALLLSADVKPVTASVAFFFAAHFVFVAPDMRSRVRRAAGILAVGLTTLLVLWGRFWAGTTIFTTARAILAKGPELRLAAPAPGTSTVSLVLFCALVVGCAAYAARGSMSRVLDLSAAVGLVFLLWVFPWSLSWYALPPLALAIAAPRSRANTLILLATLGYGLLFMQRYATLRPV
jgi:hypothetical protein